MAALKPPTASVICMIERPVSGKRKCRTELRARIRRSGDAMITPFPADGFTTAAERELRADCAEQTVARGVNGGEAGIYELTRTTT